MLQISCKLEDFLKFKIICYNSFKLLFNSILFLNANRDKKVLPTGKTIMADMSNKLKVAYLKIIINMTFIDDEEIDEKELAELFLLMTRLELDKESRFEVRAYITEISHKNLISVENLLEIIKNNSEVSHYQSLMISLAKDLINTYFSTNDTMDRDFAFLDKYKELFELSDAEINLYHRQLKLGWNDNCFSFIWQRNEHLINNTVKKN